MSDNIIRDVITRTKGELYLGVVGSVRSGKSSFIRRFMELKVLPHIYDKDLYKKVLDELPQSSEGRAIMTVEPKFVPSDQMNVTIDNDINFSARLVDCVGYVIPTATGYLNDDGTEVGQLLIKCNGYIEYKFYENYKNNGYEIEAIKKLIESTYLAEVFLSIKKENTKGKEIADELGFRQIESNPSGYVYRLKKNNN